MRPRRSFEPPVRPQPQVRVNDAIRAPRVRLIDENGGQLGIKTSDEARDYAYGKNLDLVEVAAQADPPVARVMDYGKYRYEQEQKAKLARKHQLQIHVKEIKLRPKIGRHDYETTKGHVIRFLNERAKKDRGVPKRPIQSTSNRTVTPRCAAATSDRANCWPTSSSRKM